MKNRIIFFAACLLAIGAKGRQTGGTADTLSFTVAGHINADTGTVWLRPINNDRGYYPFQTDIKVPVSNGNFILTGKLYCPTAYMVKYGGGDGKLSAEFILDPGFQTLSYNIDSPLSQPRVNNKTMKEWARDYEPIYDGVTKEWYSLAATKDSLGIVYNHHLPDSVSANLLSRTEVIRNKANAALLDYTKAHPDSYIVLWRLIEVTAYIDKPIFYSIYDELSPSIKLAPPAKTLGQKLKAKKDTHTR